MPDKFVDDYSLQLQRGEGSTIAGWVHVDGANAGTQVTVKVPELNITQTASTDAQGKAAFSFPAPGLQRWSPKNRSSTKRNSPPPAINSRTLSAFARSKRRATTFSLNGKPVFLRGVSIHAEAPNRSGRAWGEQDAETLLGWAKELGANFVRLAHYPHDERMTRLADRMGIMVWSEVPVYWMIEWENPATLTNATNQLQEMIRRDRNKASVVLWSVANETPNTPARLAFLKSLVATAHTEDPSRPVTAALLVTTQSAPSDGIHTKTLDDPLGELSGRAGDATSTSDGMKALRLGGTHALAVGIQTSR